MSRSPKSWAIQGGGAPGAPVTLLPLALGHSGLVYCAADQSTGFIHDQLIHVEREIYPGLLTNQEHAVDVVGPDQVHHPPEQSELILFDDDANNCRGLTHHNGL